jgi:hypothetical protein
MRIRMISNLLLVLFFANSATVFASLGSSDDRIATTRTDLKQVQVNSAVLGLNVNGIFHPICMESASDHRELIPRFLSERISEFDGRNSMPKCSQDQLALMNRYAKEGTLNPKVATLLPVYAIVTCGAMALTGGYLAYQDDRGPVPDPIQRDPFPAATISVAGAGIGSGYNLLYTVPKMRYLSYEAWESMALRRTGVGGLVGFACGLGGYSVMYFVDKFYLQKID